MKSDWVTAFLTSAMEFFTKMMNTMYDVLSINPVTYKDGAVWHVVSLISKGLLGCSVSLMVIFMFIGLLTDLGELFKNGHSNTIIWTFILFTVGAGAVYAAPYLMLLIFYIGKELIDSAMIHKVFTTGWVELPDAIAKATDGLSLSKGFVFFLATTFAAIVIVVSCFSIMLVVYGRLFRVYMHIALSPLAVSMAASPATRPHFLAFVRSFCGVVLEGLVIVVACAIFSAFASNFTVNNPTGIQAEAEADDDTHPDMTASEMVDSAMGGWMEEPDGKLIWTWLCEQLFLFLLMAGTIKGSDEFVSRKFAL